MKSHNMTLCDLFDRPRRYMVPLFQRPYVWEKNEQWKPLWDDISERAEMLIKQKEQGTISESIGNHFLGAVVLNQIKVFGRHVDTVEIIDGQQRLTTLQLMLAAFRDLIPKEEHQLAGDLHRLTENTGVKEMEVECFKVWPTNADRDHFVSSMNAKSTHALEKKHPLQFKKRSRKPIRRPLLIEAYLFFSNVIRDFCFSNSSSSSSDSSHNSSSSNSSSSYSSSKSSSSNFSSKEGSDNSLKNDLTFSVNRAYALYEALRRHIQLVVVDLEYNDDPQVIFETLNARSVPLLPSDLIRNFVFWKATRQKEDVDNLYKSWWSDYDERRAEEGNDERFWKQKESQGRNLRSRLDLFIHHYVQYKSGKAHNIGHLFIAFSNWWKQKADRNVENELKELRRHSDVFAELFVPKGESRVDIFAKRLRALDTTTIYPVLLMLLVGRRECILEGELDGIITDLESYLVRRMICNLGTKNNNQFFFSMISKLREAETITRSLIQEILLTPDGPARRWPDDKEFSHAWIEKPVYENMKSARCEMILSAIDQAMRNDKQEKITLEERLSIEHILPRSWKEKWHDPIELELDDRTYPDDSDETAIERRNRLIHSLGNLTLLTQKLNSEVSNGRYEKKREEIAKQSALRLNTYFQDTFTWNEREIQRRGRELFYHAHRIWPHPK